MDPKLVLDANILVRSVLGFRVTEIIRRYAIAASFYAPDVVVVEARTHIGPIAARRQLNKDALLKALDELVARVEVVDSDVYSEHEAVARRRLRSRDENDWPILATALALDCPIWTEDNDFFGCGVATWTTDRVKLFLNPAPPA